ncbi:TPA_exp: Uncharacterized protein A8136_3728 [Trichophyton benhamiae CBS 112371]|uniref:non-specific serine/threonine protein kinase n=1 Tax=Arthroderma benhamiae (strain ATCC MYA-4681 / CBS 112371) TaxID=663331 RepID=D4B1A9_ARTBC|nr:uncharacterized protein ARB_02238 [Trichophyton benhamiae CBS 112371]EFE31044.1 hypothetical protein ARB_02238 [Trichophyton benhamiae CBS 112371]DAA74230.1 TPA_exp: Uncharacterized protein A8136_3728 [Trichophyton benhamiae CBS 112371]
MRPPFLLSSALFTFARNTPKFQRVLQRLPLQFSTLPKLATSTPREAPGSQYEYIDDSVELLERYLPGGYHPISIGDLLNNRYRVVHKLGHGTFSTIWLAHDKQKAAYVAVKVSTADSTPREADVLCTIASSSSHPDHPGRAMIARIQDQFELQGPNGRHLCYVTAPARCSVAAANFCRLFAVETARSLATQLVLAVAYIHGQGFVHGDIHLGNVLIRLPSSLDQLSVDQLYEKFKTPLVEPVVRHDKQPLPAGVPSHATLPVWLGKRANEILPTEAHLILSDFGEAFSPSDPHQRKLGEQCRSPAAFLPPEAHFEPEKPISFPCDIWTLACAIWSILGSRDLFESMLATSDDISKQQMDILGPLPLEWWTAWEARPRYFDEGGQPNEGRFVYPSLEHQFERFIQKRRQGDRMGEFDAEEARALLDMIRPMLAFKPEQRATIEMVLASDWMIKWGLPEFQKLQPVN